MSNQWHGHLSRLKEQTAELKDQIAQLKETLLLIGAAVEEQRLLLEDRTKVLRSSLEQSTAGGKAPNQLPSVLTILHNPDMGAILVGPDGRYLLFNPVAEEILGSSLTRNMDPESSEFGFYLADQVTRCERGNLPWQRCAQGQATHEEVLFVKRSDVTDGIWIRTLSMPIYNDDGESNGSVAFVLDTTEQLIVETQITEVLQTLQEQLSSIELAEQLLITLTDKLSTTSLSTPKQKTPEAKTKTQPNVEESDFSPVPVGEPVSLKPITLKVQRAETAKESKATKESKETNELASKSAKTDVDAEGPSDAKANAEIVSIAATEDSKAETPATTKEAVKKGRSKETPEQRMEKGASSVDVSASEAGSESKNTVEKDAIEAVCAVEPEPSASDLTTASDRSPETEPAKVELKTEEQAEEAKQDEEAAVAAAASSNITDNKLESAVGNTVPEETGSETEVDSAFKEPIEVTGVLEVTTITAVQAELAATPPVGSEFKIETTLKSAIAAASEQVESAQDDAKVTDAQEQAKADTKVETKEEVREEATEEPSVAVPAAVVEIDAAPIAVDHIVNINRKNRKLTNTVLVVDDIPVNQKLLSLQLSRLGFEVEVASNGKEAVDAVVKKDFDIVFMDLDMPIMDGPKATAAIRNIEAVTLKYVPIVAMTSYKRDADRQRCIKAGMDDYLTKGANRKQLLEVINNFVKPVVDTTDQVARLQADRPPAQVEVTQDFDSLKNLHGQNEMQEVSRLFYSSVSTFVECLQLAIDERKVDAVTHFSHCIKGPADSLGLTQLSNILSDMIAAAESEDWTNVVLQYMNLRSNYTQVIGRLKDLFGADHLTPVAQ